MRKSRSSFKAVIGIGASAGGLEALQQFIQGIGDVRGYSYIVCQHLSPTHKSRLADLLGKNSVLPVSDARHGQVLKSDEILICPPNKNIFVDDERVILSGDDNPNYLTKPSVDLFFESIARVFKARAVGVILSGTGSDGARGIRAIKAEGGVSIVQLPDTAKYDGMPNAAVLSGHVDLVMPASEIVAEIHDIFMLGGDRPGFLDDSEEPHEYLQKIILLLKKNRQVDFTLYKLNTIKRRVERRMSYKKIASLQAYHQLLLQDGHEIDALFDEILIHVTEFFREPDSFDVLRDFIGDYLEKTEQKRIRVWVAGCSTGEEAYTLAILLHELLGADIIDYTIQIFATDIDEASIQLARNGRYSQAALASLPTSIVRRYFDVVDNEYRVKSLIREVCVFSVQDLIKDPPFMNMDLVTCRNTLIYFKPELQIELLEKFHYVLKKNGILMLGRSESISNRVSPLFRLLDKNHRLFCADASQKTHLKVLRNEKRYDYLESHLSKPRVSDVMQDIILSKIEQYLLPSCVVINENYDLIYSKGQNPYIISQPGQRNDNIFHNIHHDLSVELRHALLEAGKQRTSVRTVLREIDIFGIKRFVRMVIMPITSKSSQLWLICFQEEEKAFFDSIIATESQGASDHQLKAELERTQSRMNTMVAELETNNEEMQALNEELQSANEKLQSSNEELETTNEELQSTNEELHSAYTELQISYEAKDRESKDHQQTRKQLELYSERLEMVLKASEMGFCQIHIPPHEDDIWSERFANILDFKIGELPQDNRVMLDWLENHIMPEFLQGFQQHFAEFIQGKNKVFDFSYQIRTRKSQQRWIRQQAKALQRDQDGQVQMLMATFLDVTSEYQKTAEIRLLNERLKQEVKDQEVLIDQQQVQLGQMVETLNIGVWDWLEDTQHLTLSPSLRAELELDQPPLSLQDFLSCLQIDAEVDLFAKIQAIIDGEMPSLRQKVSFKSEDGTDRYYVFHCMLVDKPLPSRRITGFIIDVTHETLRENMLEQLVVHNDLLQSLTGIGFYELDVANNNIWRSRGYCELLALDANSETVSNLQTYFKRIHAEDLPRYQAFIGGLVFSEPAEMTYRLVDGLGKQQWVTEKAMLQKDFIFGLISVNASIDDD